MEFIKKLYSILEDPLKQSGYEIVRIQFNGVKRKTLQIMIERLDGVPVNLDDCTKVNDQASVLLDVHDVIASAYDLEISSAGLERPLVKLADYERFKGKAAVVKTNVAISGRKRFAGTLSQVEDNKVTLNLEHPADSGEAAVIIPYDWIASGHLQNVI